MAHLISDQVSEFGAAVALCNFALQKCNGNYNKAAETRYHYRGEMWELVHWWTSNNIPDQEQVEKMAESYAEVSGSDHLVIMTSAVDARAMFMLRLVPQTF